jgi:DNA-damage-inducible protein J
MNTAISVSILIFIFFIIFLNYFLKRGRHLRNIYSAHTIRYDDYSENKSGMTMAISDEATNINIQLDKKLKEQAESLFSELGISMTTAVNIFLRQSVIQQKIPFEITLNTANDVTIAAREEAKRISRDPNIKRYSRFYETAAEAKDDV